jgi:hypothetical protein
MIAILRDIHGFDCAAGKDAMGQLRDELTSNEAEMD